MDRAADFFRYLWSRIRRRFSELTPLRLFFLLLFATALVCTSVAPFMRGPSRSWFDVGSWEAAYREGAWVMVVCAVVLRYEKEFVRAFARSEVSHSYQTRMADLAGAVDRIKTLDLRRPADVQHFRETVLRCVMSGIAEQLNLDPTTLTANLLVLTDKGPRTMIVTARSDGIRPTGAEHVATEDLLAWRAIRSGGIEVENDMRRAYPRSRKPYRSVVAIPVTRDEVAYGGLSIDCSVPFAFYGHRRRIYCQCRPYIALLSLTFGDSSPYHECRFSPPHTG